MGAEKIFQHFVLEFIGWVIMAFALFVLKAIDYAEGAFIMIFFVYAAMSTWFWVTGAHFNPIISLVVRFRTDRSEEYGYGMMIVYILAQYAGYFAGGILSWWFLTEAGELRIAKEPNNEFIGDEDYLYGQAFGLEIFGTAIFVLMYLMQTHPKTWMHMDPGFRLWGISITYICLLMVTKETAGGSLNPAYALAQNIWDACDTGNNDSIEFIWIYTLCPLIGGIVGYMFYEYVWMLRIDTILIKEYQDGQQRELPKLKNNELPPVLHETKIVGPPSIKQEKPPKIASQEHDEESSPQEEELDNEEEVEASED